MKRYSIIHALGLAFFSREFYRDVARHWRGIGATYLLLLAVLPSLSIAVELQLAFNRAAPKILDQLPAVTIERGAVSIDRPEPHFIRNPDDGTILAIIDTTGKTALASYATGVLVTKSQLIYKVDPVETRVVDLSGVQSFQMSRADQERWLGRARVWGGPILLAFLVTVFYLTYLTQAVAFGTIAFGILRASRIAVAYSVVVRLAVVGSTALAFLESLAPLFDWTPTWSVQVTLAAGYLLFGVWSSVVEEGSPHFPHPQPDAAHAASDDAPTRPAIQRSLAPAVAFMAGILTTLIGQALASHFQEKQAQREHRVAALRDFSSACNQTAIAYIELANLPLHFTPIAHAPEMSASDKYQAEARLTTDSLRSWRTHRADLVTQTDIVNALFKTQLSPDFVVPEELPVEFQVRPGSIDAEALFQKLQNEESAADLVRRSTAMLGKAAERLNSYCRESTRALAAELE